MTTMCMERAVAPVVALEIPTKYGMRCRVIVSVGGRTVTTCALPT
jgi:hypothetical protein